MKNVSRFNIDQTRQIASKVIRNELYTEEDYPEKYFPDLTIILCDFFIEMIKVQHPEWKDTEKKDEIEIVKLAKEVLSFKYILKYHPHTIVLIYRSYIKKFIKYKHACSRRGKEDWEDIYQEVMTRLISDKINRIRDRFDFEYSNETEVKKSFFTSYLMVTVRNIYMDIIRERNVRLLTGGNVLPMNESFDTYDNKDENMLTRVAIENEFQKLDTILLLYHKSRARLELCLKLKCRIPVKEKDISMCFPAFNNDEMNLLSRDFKNMKDKNVFDTVITVFNRHEGMENKSDTLRKWVSLKVDEITSHMNHTHPSDVYTNKNFLDLLTLYFDKKYNEDEKSNMTIQQSEKGYEQ